MKRTCNNCRALSGEICSLGYKNESRQQLGVKGRDHSGYFRGMKPSEECPKPMTYAKWARLNGLGQ